eukprot:1161691-Pelagomonas_calceolata.AAC.5
MSSEKPHVQEEVTFQFIANCCRSQESNGKSKLQFLNCFAPQCAAALQLGKPHHRTLSPPPTPFPRHSTITRA